MPTLTPLELVETFPEAAPIVRRNIKIWKTIYRESEPVYKELLEELMRLVYVNGNETEHGIKFVMERFYRRPVAAMNGHISRLERLRRLYELKDRVVPEGEITEKEILQAKQFPIGDVIEITRTGF